MMATIVLLGIIALAALAVAARAADLKVKLLGWAVAALAVIVAFFSADGHGWLANLSGDDVATAMFVVFGLSAAGAAVAVVFSQNVVRMAFYLVISLGSTAGLFFMLGADFVGATQLLIYVGGTVVLLIFGVMLTATGPMVAIKSNPGDFLTAVLVGGLFLAMLIGTVMQVDWDGNAALLSTEHPESGISDGGLAAGNTSRSLGTAFLGPRFDRDLGADHKELSTGYLLPFEIISVHLLVVLVGAAYLARAKRRVTRAEE